MDRFARGRLMFSPPGSKPHFSRKNLELLTNTLHYHCKRPSWPTSALREPLLVCVGLCVASLMLLLHLCHVLFGSNILSDPNLYFFPSHYNSDHLFDFLSKPCPRKIELADYLVYLQLTLKPPLILYLLMNQ